MCCIEHMWVLVRCSERMESAGTEDGNQERPAYHLLQTLSENDLAIVMLPHTEEHGAGGKADLSATISKVACDVYEQHVREGEVWQYGTVAFVQGLYAKVFFVWECISTGQNACMDLFIRCEDNGANKISMQVYNTNSAGYKRAKFRMLPNALNIGAESLPASIIPPSKGKKVVNAGSHGSRGGNLRLKPGLHGISKPRLGKLDHGHTGAVKTTTSRILFSSYDEVRLHEAQDQWLEMVRGEEVAVFHGIPIEVGSLLGGVYTDTLGEGDVYKQREDEIINSLYSNWC